MVGTRGRRYETDILGLAAGSCGMQIPAPVTRWLDGSTDIWG